ncbi:MAG: methionyl-tRNA formyltransferase [Planctomycetota bacterium]|nr:MAG: methionyl-tRNA formyltransferase [Planctomycetota bacterium]
MPFRIAMLGTGEFALPTFQSLADSHHTMVGLVTQPDRVASGGRVHPNVMKEFALHRKIPVLQPPNINTAESLAELYALQADLFLVAAYGQILSAEVIGVPPRGCYNLHGSLLPKYRGAAPIQYAVWKGEATTGVSIFQIVPRLDAGPILAEFTTPIGPKETSGDLENRLASLVAPVTVQFIDDLEYGRLNGRPQNPAEVTRAPKLKKEFGMLDWSQSTAALDCQIRAMQPWPTPHTYLHVTAKPPQRILVLEIDPAPLPATGMETAAGTIVRNDGRSLLVRTGDGACAIQRIQPIGKRAMAVSDWLRGNAAPVGSRLGTET